MEMKKLLFAIVLGVVVAIILMPISNPNEIIWWVLMIILVLVGNFLFQVLTRDKND